MRRPTGSLWLLGALFWASCAPTPPPPAPAALRTEDSLAILTDPCAVRLGEIADALLLYYSQNRQLPEKIEALISVPGGASLQLVCPESGKPYLYAPSNLAGPGLDRRLLVYDATAVHQGAKAGTAPRRWGIVAAPARPGQPVNIWVVALDEPTFRYLIQPALSLPR